MFGFFFIVVIFYASNNMLCLYLYSYMFIYKNNIINVPPVFCFRVFVNRSLSLDKIKFFGFDMDYTLAGTVTRRKH